MLASLSFWLGACAGVGCMAVGVVVGASVMLSALSQQDRQRIKRQWWRK